MLLGLAKVATKYNFSSNPCVHSNNVSMWTTNSKWWTCEWVSKFKGARTNLWNIFHVTSLNIIEIFSCHVDLLFVTWKNIIWWSHKYFSMWIKVQHENMNYSTNGCIYLFEWCFLICNVNMGKFWRMKTLNCVKHYKQMNLITNVAQRFTMSPNLVVDLKCTTFKTFITTKTI